MASVSQGVTAPYYPSYSGTTSAWSGYTGDMSSIYDMERQVSNWQNNRQDSLKAQIMSQMSRLAGGLHDSAQEGTKSIDALLAELMGGNGPSITRSPDSIRADNASRMNMAMMAGGIQDPFGGQRSQYQTQLSELENNIRQFMIDPTRPFTDGGTSGNVGGSGSGGGAGNAYTKGMQAAIQAAERSSAKHGTLGGGTGAVDVEDASARFYNQYYQSQLAGLQNQAQQLAHLSGAQFAPQGGEFMMRMGIADADRSQRESEFSRKYGLETAGLKGNLLDMRNKFSYGGESDYLQLLWKLLEDQASGITSGVGGGGIYAPPGFDQVPFMGG